VIAIVPARGGSKRIPRKNLVDFYGEPIMSGPLKMLLGSDLFDEVIVSTDDAQIAEVANGLGASVPFVRPQNLATDHASTAEVVIHAVDDYVRRSLIDPPVVMVVYPTAVFLKRSDILSMLDVLKTPDIDHVMTAGRYASPIQRAWVSSGSARVRRVNPDTNLTRSQDLEVTYFDAGQAYASVPSAWLRMLNGEEVTTGMIELDPWRVWDIDNPKDLEMARLLYKFNQQQGPETSE
jgi:N-acylneuraminate cytidylyltransferase